LAGFVDNLSRFDTAEEYPYFGTSSLRLLPKKVLTLPFQTDTLHEGRCFIAPTSRVAESWTGVLLRNGAFCCVPASLTGCNNLRSGQGTRNTIRLASCIRDLRLIGVGHHRTDFQASASYLRLARNKEEVLLEALRSMDGGRFLRSVLEAHGARRRDRTNNERG